MTVDTLIKEVRTNTGCDCEVKFADNLSHVGSKTLGEQNVPSGILQVICPPEAHKGEETTFGLHLTYANAQPTIEFTPPKTYIGRILEQNKKVICFLYLYLLILLLGTLLVFLVWVTAKRVNHYKV
jgi:hypothetical protein